MMISFNSSLKDTLVALPISHSRIHFQFLIKGYWLQYKGEEMQKTFNSSLKDTTLTLNTTNSNLTFNSSLKDTLYNTTAVRIANVAFNSSLKDTVPEEIKSEIKEIFQFLIKGYHDIGKPPPQGHVFQFLIKGYVELVKE